jgi:hypothetical protein
MNVCSTLGIDPIQSEKTMFSSIFRIGEFYHQLSIEALKFLFKEMWKGTKLVNLNDIKVGVFKIYTERMFQLA